MYRDRKTQTETILKISSITQGAVWLPAEVRKLLKIDPEKDKVVWIKRTDERGTIEIVIRNSRSQKDIISRYF